MYSHGHFSATLETLKGGHLDFSHLVKLEKKKKIYIYISELYMKKQYKSSITKNHKIKQKIFFGCCSLERLRSLLTYFLICARNKKKALWENQMTNDA